MNVENYGILVLNSLKLNTTSSHLFLGVDFTSIISDLIYELLY